MSFNDYMAEMRKKVTEDLVSIDSGEYFPPGLKTRRQGGLHSVPESNLSSSKNYSKISSNAVSVDKINRDKSKVIKTQPSRKNSDNHQQQMQNQYSGNFKVESEIPSTLHHHEDPGSPGVGNSL